MSWYNMPPSDLMYSDFENFECPYDHQCDGCEYDCYDGEA
jgi:hypothetical protein